MRPFLVILGVVLVAVAVMCVGSSVMAHPDFSVSATLDHVSPVLESAAVVNPLERCWQEATDSACRRCSTPDANIICTCNISDTYLRRIDEWRTLGHWPDPGEPVIVIEFSS